MIKKTESDKSNNCYQGLTAGFIPKTIAIKDIFEETKTNKSLINEMIKKSLFETARCDKIYSYYLNDPKHLTMLLKSKIIKFDSYKDFPVDNFHFIIDMIDVTGDQDEILGNIFIVTKKNIEILFGNIECNLLYLSYESYIDDFVKKNLVRILAIFFENDYQKVYEEERSEFRRSLGYQRPYGIINNYLSDFDRSFNLDHKLEFNFKVVKGFFDHYKDLVTKDEIEKLMEFVWFSINHDREFIEKQLKFFGVWKV